MFKRGSEYTRDEIAKIVRPDNPPRGGDWTTGYARIENNLFAFMNIGVAGRTGHDLKTTMMKNQINLFGLANQINTHQIPSFRNSYQEI